jgi:O-succinylbenzoate synthase
MASFAQDVTPDFGFDHLKMMTSVKDPETRRDMEIKRREGYSTEMLRQELKGEPLPEISPTPMPDPIDAKVDLLERSREQLQKKIEDWTRKLEELDHKIEILRSGATSDES